MKSIKADYEHYGDLDIGNTTDKIVGGTTGTANEFPFMAVPKVQGFCGASLIHEDILVTAAHCKGSFKGKTVFIGGLRRDGKDAKNKITAVEERTHPNSNPTSTTNVGDDIMIVKPKTKSTQQIAPWNTDNNTPIVDNSVRVIGWGSTSETGRASDVLRKVDLNVVDSEICRQTYSNINTFFDASKVICAAAPGKDSCYGDSGR